MVQFGKSNTIEVNSHEQGLDCVNLRAVVQYNGGTGDRTLDHKSIGPIAYLQTNMVYW